MWRLFLSLRTHPILVLVGSRARQANPLTELNASRNSTHTSSNADFQIWADSTVREFFISLSYADCRYVTSGAHVSPSGTYITSEIVQHNICAPEFTFVGPEEAHIFNWSSCDVIANPSTSLFAASEEQSLLYLNSPCSMGPSVYPLCSGWLFRWFFALMYQTSQGSSR